MPYQPGQFVDCENVLKRFLLQNWVTLRLHLGVAMLYYAHQILKLYSL